MFKAWWDALGPVDYSPNRPGGRIARPEEYPASGFGRGIVGSAYSPINPTPPPKNGVVGDWGPDGTNPEDRGVIGDWGSRGTNPDEYMYKLPSQPFTRYNPSAFQVPPITQPEWGNWYDKLKSLGGPNFYGQTQPFMINRNEWWKRG
jgi:hypothetical protein